MVERRTVDQIDEVNAAIVKYGGNHLNKYFGTRSEANVIRILTKLRETASPDGSDELRCNISLVISKMVNRKWSSVASLLIFGDIVLLLLRDECSDIRETISQAVQCLRSEYTGCEALVVSSLAEVHFIDWLDKQFRQFNSESPWTVWIQLIGMQLDRNVQENEVVVDEVFDKCESNVFGEVVLVCKKLMKKVRQSVTESGLCINVVKDTFCSIESDWPEL